MAEETTSSPPREQSDYSNVDVLSYGGKVESSVIRNIGSVTERRSVISAQKLASDLRAAVGEEEKGKSTFLENLNIGKKEKPFELEKVDELRMQFGGGEATREADGSIKFPDGTSTQAEELSKEAQKAIDTATGYLKYADVMKKAAIEGKKPEDVGGSDWKSTREQALDSMWKLDGMQADFPILNDFRDAEERRNFLEATLAADPALGERVSSKMNGIMQEAEGLPSVEGDPQTLAAQREREAAEEQINQAMERSLEEIKGLGIEGVDINDIKGKIESRTRTGTQTELEATLHIIKEELSKNDPVIKLLHDRENNAQRIVKLTEDRDRINKDPARAELAADLTERIKTAVALQSDLGRKLDDIEMSNPGAEIDSKNKLAKITALTSESKLSGDQYSSPLAHELQQVVEAKRKVVEAEKTITARKPEADKARAQQMAERLIAESQLIDDLNDVLPDAIKRVLSDRYDDMEMRRNAELDEIDKENAEDLSEQQAAQLRAVGESLKKKYISFDEVSREKVVDRLEIREDVLFAAYHGEDAVDRLIARDLGIADWKTADLDALPDEQKELLKTAVEKYGRPYQEKLFSSFFEARTRSDEKIKRFGKERSGSLALKEHEWQLLQKNFGSKIESGLGASKEGKAILEKLASQGITRESKDWIKYLLAALGGTLILAAVPLAGVSAIAAGAGGAGSLGAAARKF